MQMRPLESQTGRITGTQCVCVSNCVCAHSQHSSSTTGPGEREALIPFEAHNPSLMFVVRRSFIYPERSLA